jgi:phosphatidylglycerol:prolipoprotein diacylglycerol transferase
MPGPFVHRIDPIVADVGGVLLWWYGVSYALGFLQLRFYLSRHHRALGLTAREAWTLTLLLIVGVLVGGRSIEIAFDEWPFYREHPALMPAFWLGGMAARSSWAWAGSATSSTGRSSAA